jgi:hypothetical protein
LTPSPPLKVPDWGASKVWVFFLLQGLSGLKISWDIARVFLTAAALMVLLTDVLYSSGSSKHNVNCPFHCFCHFSSLTALMLEFV